MSPKKDGKLPVLDSHMVEQLQGIPGEQPGQTLFQEAAQLFLETTREQIASLESALGQDDHETTFQLAHSIKGAALNLGAHCLGEKATLLESAGRNRDMTLARSHFPYLKNEFAALASELTKQLA